MSALVISTVSRPVLSTATATQSLRLTRRGRMVLLGIPALVLSAVLLLSVFALFMGALASPANAATKYSPIDMADYASKVTVLQGESLWSIAAASDSSRDVREVVGEIVALNELTTNVVQAGQQLFVPIHK
ncbi:LysM peptidoglycan-binding domain-containing protein [Arthrobacter sp. GMC3]|uniref:LysM peptidoglycan-binding domain-containing protein n=1 Tax=Arthrobacter sp. GMC3 TaxID=2058894 RepID=UPI000CE2E66E|nr:LysM peptidoglycan-binding domain-containing protein [Arthrobacter sp. GMC3]